MEIVRRGSWDIGKLLTLLVPLGEFEGVDLERWPIVACSHYFCGQGTSLDMKTANPLLEFSHNIVCLLVVTTFEQRCCETSFE